MSIESLKQINIKTKCILWKDLRLPHPGIELISPDFTIDDLNWNFEVLCSWKEREVTKRKVFNFGQNENEGETWIFTINCSNKVSDYVIIPYVETAHQKYVKVSPTIANTEISRDSLKRILESDQDIVTMLFLFSPACLDMNFKGILLEDGLDKESVQSLSLNGLSKDMEEMFNNSEKSDTIVKCGDKSFSVHRNIITARSNVLLKMFQTDMAEKKTGILTIADIDQNLVEHFLRFLYSGKVDGMSLQMARELYNVADRYEVLTLRRLCASYILDNISEDMICDLLLLADRTGDREFHAGVASFAAKTNGLLQTAEWKTFARQNPSAAIKVYVPDD